MQVVGIGRIGGDAVECEGAMTKRKYQGEQAGHFTDEDGYKDHSAEAHPVAPSHPKSPEALVANGEYPHSGEIALTGKAVTERWPIKPTMRESLVDRMAGIISNGEDNDSIAAGRVMVAMDKQNVDSGRPAVTGGGIAALQINVGATQPADVDFEYLAWKKNRLMGKEQDVEPEPPPLAEIVTARRVTRVPVTADSTEGYEETDPLVSLFFSIPQTPKLRLFAG